MWRFLRFAAVALAVVSATAGFTAQAQQQDMAAEQFQNAQIANLIGLPVWSSDGKEIGLVISASSGADGKVDSIYIAVGSFLGLGERNVEVAAEMFEDLGDRLQLSITAQEAEALPDAKQGA
jgi:hypothetical protein